jgi:hypothetical protein
MRAPIIPQPAPIAIAKGWKNLFSKPETHQAASFFQLLEN